MKRIPRMTVAQLALAVGQSEIYVRQHIHRKHLAVTREGRRVYVELDEARRWAKERGISFRSPIHVATAITAMQDRAARMTVLAWKAPDGQLRNLFTFLRHRRKDAIGPWESEPDKNWRIESLSGDLCLLSFDESLKRCGPILDRVLESGVLRVKGREVRYALEPVPRHHWAYRDQRTSQGDSIRSPFARHSAEIREYWSFAAQPRRRWREKFESSSSPGRSLFARLGFPLDRRSDRVGNLMIAGAEDGISCDLRAHNDRTLTLAVEADDCTPGSYCGMVWASHSGDEVHRRQIAIDSGKTRIALGSDVDSVGFEVFRVADGQCVDRMSHHLLMEASLCLNVQMGPTLRLQDRQRSIAHKVNPFHDVSTVKVHADQNSPELDRRIRQQWLDHLSHRRESFARKRGDLVRFDSGKLGQVGGHFLGILAADREPPSPIYFADPYCMESAKTPVQIKLWLEIFAVTTGAPLRILCCTYSKGSSLPRWWSSLPKQINSHVAVQIFTRHGDGRPAFHDRYLITPKREVILTNSVSGWGSDGVTFTSSPYGVYRAEAERLWSMGLAVPGCGLLCGGIVLMPFDIDSDRLLPDQARAIVWRIFGEGASPFKGRSSYELVRPMVEHHVSAADRQRVLREIQGWFESDGNRHWLRPELMERAAAIIVEGVRAAGPSEAAVWAIGSIDAELAASLIRSDWSDSAIDGFVQATLRTLHSACDRNRVLKASRGLALDLDSANAEIPADAFVREGRIATFQNLLNRGVGFVGGGLHAAIGNLIDLVLTLRPDLFSSLVMELDHPVVQARAAMRTIKAARLSNHRVTLGWIRADSCEAEVALAIVHTLDTVNMLDSDLRRSGGQDVSGHTWFTELRPPRGDLDAAAASLLAGLAHSLSRLEPCVCARWIGELLTAAPRSLHSHGDGKPLRVQQIESACTRVLVRLVQTSWSGDLVTMLSAGLRTHPTEIWTRHLADLAWALRESVPKHAAKIARSALRSHQAHVTQVLKHNRSIVDWRYRDHREWIAGLGACLAIANRTLDLRKWVVDRCGQLPLSVWDADTEEDRLAFITAERVARHWFLVAFQSIPRLKELGGSIDPAGVLSLVETFWDHCRFVQPYVVGRSASSVAAEFATRCAVEYGDASERWLLDLARHPAAGARVLWAAIDQHRLKLGQGGNQAAWALWNRMDVTELASISSDRLETEDDRVSIPSNTGDAYGCCWARSMRPRRRPSRFSPSREARLPAGTRFSS